MTTVWKIKILFVFGTLNALCNAQLIEASDGQDRWIEDVDMEIKEDTDDGFAANSNGIGIYFFVIKCICFKRAYNPHLVMILI